MRKVDEITGELVETGEEVEIAPKTALSPLEILENELNSPLRKRKTHPSHKEIHMLSAKEEASRRKRKSTSKKYDGRAFGRRGVTALAVKDALNGFYEGVELPELKQALQISNDPRYMMLLAAVSNPRFTNTSFAELCRKCKMSLQDVVDVWRNHIQTKGLVRMMNHIPDIMEDVAKDSLSKEVLCDMCQGKGKIIGGEVNKRKNPVCPACHGDGVIRMNGNKDARNLTFETVGLIKGGGGNMVNVNINNQNGGRGLPSIEDQIMDVDKIFDAEFTEVPDGDTRDKGVPEAEKNPGSDPGKSGSTGAGDGNDAEGPESSISIFADDPEPQR